MWKILTIISLTLAIFIGQGATQYYGTEIGKLVNSQHDVSGTVYAADVNHILIVNFSYDGTGPESAKKHSNFRRRFLNYLFNDTKPLYIDAYFYIGTTGSKPSSSGIQIPDETGSNAVLGAYSKVDIMLTLPEGKFIQQVRWLSVWCNDFGVDFGHVIFPSYIDIPVPAMISTFSTRNHGVSSGSLQIKNTRTIFISKFNYDGKAPDAYFWVGKGQPDANGQIIPDENGSMSKLGAYTAKDLTLRLPSGLSINDIDYLAVWCQSVEENFGHVEIPPELKVPVYIEKPQEELANCERLHDCLNVAWEINGDAITIALTGALEENGYMSFGISGSETRSTMIGADVTVAYFHDNQPKVKDYYINAKSQCSGGSGVCSDTSLAGQNDVTLISGRQRDHVSTIRYTRKLNTGQDNTDKVIRTDAPMYVLFASGKMNDLGQVTKHSTQTKGDQQLHFGRTANTSSCSPVKCEPTCPGSPWKPAKLVASEGKTFRVRLGPAGGCKGYNAITKHQSWGVAYYVDDKLIPEITVTRGQEVTFIVEGGNNPNNSARYHPLYITDDPQGGYSLKTRKQKEAVKVYAGIDTSDKATASGHLCEYQPKGRDMMATSETFDEYFGTLKLVCDNDGKPGELKWTPDGNTPDLVYYQCFSHNYLGWKINVENGSAAQRSSSTAFIFVITFLACLARQI